MAATEAGGPEDTGGAGRSTAPPVGSLSEVPVDKISRNKRNPRQTFDPKTIERLATSLGEIGLQVPITVYRPGNTGDDFVLLDGERRFRAAKHLNWKTIPALIVNEPSANENAIRMFNIHMLREEWEEIETAWALEQIIEETGEAGDRELQKRTGLSIDRIKNMKRVLSFPRSVQERVATSEIPYQLLVELDKNILTKHKRDLATKQGALPDMKTSEIRDAILRKYESNVERDVVDLRLVGTLLDTARSSGKVGERAKTALTRLFSEPSITIDEAYEFGAASSVELSKVLRDAIALPSRVSDLLDGNLDEDQQRQVRATLTEVIGKLQGQLGRL